MTVPSQKVLIVSASSSVGRAVVDAFTRDGAEVLATYAHTPVEGAGRSVIASQLDLLDERSIEDFARGPLAHFGPVQTAVFLAGVLPGKSLAAYSFAEMDRVMAVNVTAQAKVIQALLPHLAHPSLLLMMSSISAERGSYDPIYAASKGAIISLVKSLAASLGPKTRANALTPSLIEDTTMYEQMADARREYHRNQAPNRSLLAKEDLARVVVDLTKPHWCHLNGAVIALNGGAHV